MHRMSQITYSIQFDMVRKINVTNEPVEYTSGFKKKKKGKIAKREAGTATLAKELSSISFRQ